MDVQRGVLAVLSFARYRVPPLSKLWLPAGLPQAIKTFPRLFKEKSGSASNVFPGRAISTSSGPCQIANAVIGVGICLLIYAVPGLAAQARELVAVQVGIYAESANAKQMAVRLERAGFPVVTDSVVDKQGRTLIRVLVGPYDTRGRAMSAKTALSARGWDGFIDRYPTPVFERAQKGYTPPQPRVGAGKRQVIRPPTEEADFTAEPITPIDEQDIDLDEADAVVSTTSELANVVGGIFVGHKSMELTIRDREFTPTFTTLGFSLTRIMKRFYLTLSYEESIDDDIESDPGGLIFYSRRDAHIELNYILSKRLTLSAGFRTGETDAHFTGSSFGTSEDGFFIAGSYAHSFGKRGTLSASLAVADLDGEVSLTEPFVDTTAFVVGPTPPEDIEGNAVGASLGIVWAGAVSEKTRYLIGVRLQRYEFEDDVVFGGLDLTYDQDFDSISLGLVHRF